MRDRLRALALRLGLTVLGVVPWRWGQRVGALVGLVLWWLPTRMARTTHINLELCFPRLSNAERRALARASLGETGRLSIETAALWSRYTTQWGSLIHSTAGEVLIDEARGSGRGVLVLAPHFGNWEALNFWLGARYRAAVVYEPPRSRRVEAQINRWRSATGSEPVPTTVSGIRRVLQSLRESGVVGLLPDQVPPRSSGVHVPFFGVPALTMTLAHRLVRATGAFAVIGVAARNARSGFDLSFEPVDDALYGEDPRIAAQVLNRAVERVVRRDPKQYQWEYKRFKRGPLGAETQYPSDAPSQSGVKKR